LVYNFIKQCSETKIVNLGSWVCFFTCFCSHYVMYFFNLKMLKLTNFSTSLWFLLFLVIYRFRVNINQNNLFSYIQKLLYWCANIYNHRRKARAGEPFLSLKFSTNQKLCLELHWQIITSKLTSQKSLLIRGFKLLL